MSYFDGLAFQHHNYLPALHTWIDRAFPYYALNFCASGRILWAMHNHEPRFLNGPVAWWTVPGLRYVYGAAPGETWEHFYATFSGPRIRRMVQKGLLKSAVEQPHFVAISNAERFARSFYDLFHALEHSGTASPRAVHHLEDLLLQLGEQTPPEWKISPLEAQVLSWREEVRAAPERDWDVEGVARRLNVSAVHLRRTVNKLTGVPPQRFVTERRLDAVAAQLRGSNTPIKVLSMQYGFQDLPHFTRLFTRRYGLPPAAYRRETQLVSSS
jgi:AraC family multidrug resistance transcriptional activator